MYNKSYLFFVFTLAALVCGCAQKHKKQEKVELASNFFDEVECPTNSLKGTGAGKNENEALSQARAEIASQITLSISVAEEFEKKQSLTGSKEVLKSKYNSQIKHTTELANAHDAKIKATKKINGKTLAVACMSKDDAAKPYLNQLPSINDSLNLSIETALVQEHPLRKKEAAKLAEDLKIRQAMIVQILHGLGLLPRIPKNNYDDMIAKNKDFFAGFKIIWHGTDEEISQILAAKISSRYRIETGDCTVGLKLVPGSTEYSCEVSRFGPQCSYLPILEGRSCADELYFVLRGPMIRGTGLKDETDARRKLFATIPLAQFWNNWFEELDKYR